MTVLMNSAKHGARGCLFPEPCVKNRGRIHRRTYLHFFRLPAIHLHDVDDLGLFFLVYPLELLYNLAQLSPTNGPV